MSRKRISIVWLVLSALIILAMVMSTACAEEKGKREIKNPETFIQDQIGDADSLDPAYAYDTASAEQIQAIYEPLIYYDGERTDKFKEILCTEYNVSDDGKTYRFKIRKGVKFHNGNDLTPEDVEYSFERGMVQDYVGGPQALILEPLLGVSHTWDDEGNIVVPLEDIKDAVEVDGDWVQFNLPTPFAPFLHVLTGSWGSIVDKEWCIAQGDWDGTQASYEALNNPEANATPLNDVANGTGPYKLSRWDKGVEIVLERNDDYWGKEGSIKTFIYKIVDEWTTRKLELLNGDVDHAYVPRANIGELEGVEGLKVYKDLPQMVADAFFFQFQIGEESTRVGSGKLDGNGIPLDFFSDLDVRLGFTYCFDWETYIQQALLGEAQQVASPAIEGLPYRNPDQEKYSLDLAKAEEHFKAAWGGQVWEKGFKFTLLYNTGNLARQTACQILRDNVKKVNSKFQVEVLESQWSLILDEIFSGLVPMFQIGWQADYPDPHNFFHPFMHSGGAYSGIQGYNNPRVDELIEEGVRETDPDARKDIYYELQQIYHDDAPGIMLAQILGRRYFQDWIKGYIFNPIDPSQVGHYNTLSKGY
ncbi:MAG: ABC transporter substrate-binding protein [Dehalococcoidia bacterium]|nr:ABC transporter substrate-binding protein [Dehalococcoidia bacterium]